MRYHLLAALFFLSLGSLAVADCPRCDYYRQKNAQAPAPKYDYYEDYLKSAKEGRNGLQDREASPEFEEERG